MEILGIQIDNLLRSEILKKIESFLTDGKFHQIVTVNPEFILCAEKDEEFKNILNQSDLNVADGVGIRFAFLRFGKLLKSRIAGADMMLEIFQIANEKKLPVFLAINKNGLSSYEEIKNVLSEKYPHIEFGGDDIDSSNFYSYQLLDTRYRILFCNFGAPHQEKFINSLKDAKISLAVGVGGSFDYLTGKLKRAPKWMQFFGVEWLWRLLLQPRRIRRIINAVIIFPIKVLFSK